MLEIINFFIIK